MTVAEIFKSQGKKKSNRRWRGREEERKGRIE